MQPWATAEGAAQHLAQPLAQLALEAQLPATGAEQLRHQPNAARTVRTRVGTVS